MDIVKMKRDTEGDLYYLVNACKYLEDPERVLALGGYGVNPYNVESTVYQMIQVKKYFSKTSGNPLIHFIISYGTNVYDVETAAALSEKIASYFYDTYQTLWCLHEKERWHNERMTSLYHTHIVINSVSYRNGRMYDGNPHEINQFCNYVSGVTGQPNRFYFGKKEENKKPNMNGNNYVSFW
ncbi:MAG: relaxase/mobilization nuclease domain-containing protein [Ruminococcus sp.]|nr:relaxase/mobilization nuclease domain-containing protein [Ruminococcus sp.]